MPKKNRRGLFYTEPFDDATWLRLHELINHHFGMFGMQQTKLVYSLCCGHTSDKDQAKIIAATQKTVTNTWQAIYKKMGVRSRYAVLSNIWPLYVSVRG